MMLPVAFQQKTKLLSFLARRDSSGVKCPFGFTHSIPLKQILCRSFDAIQLKECASKYTNIAVRLTVSALRALVATKYVFYISSRSLQTKVKLLGQYLEISIINFMRKSGNKLFILSKIRFAFIRKFYSLLTYKIKLKLVGMCL